MWVTVGRKSDYSVSSKAGAIREKQRIRGIVRFKNHPTTNQQHPTTLRDYQPPPLPRPSTHPPPHTPTKKKRIKKIASTGLRDAGPYNQQPLTRHCNLARSPGGIPPVRPCPGAGGHAAGGGGGGDRGDRGRVGVAAKDSSRGVCVCARVLMVPAAVSVYASVSLCVRLCVRAWVKGCARQRQEG